MGSLVIADIVCNRIIPVITLNRVEDAQPLAGALKDAGMNVLEITLRTKSAMDALEILAQDPELLVGVGSVTNVNQLEKAHSLGAKFAVSPGIRSNLVMAAQELGLIYIPGVATASEIMLGIDCGLSTLKFFPSETLGGVPALKAMSAPFPEMSFIPTGGINSDNAGSYLDQKNVLAIGGSWMVSPSLIEANNFDEISRLATIAIKQFAVEPK
ncbi:MAG TPA: bifunctional 4-hydroxy-2-oxoglutarate aldolase/2-dehydro-3-deoxy-phosphogluconate aldolase [Candidatus Paceibacterota bacterium]|nr:bifunctional 4-hydroxy-2-oxoglutarate aldolase/2-dehydro-3-deoxy-phosphogluconate aldolase [Candidatus Paceibacterota bacterium]